MRLAFLPKYHPNEHEMRALRKLARCELAACLLAFGQETNNIEYQDIGGVSFLCADVADLTDELRQKICNQAYMAFCAELLPGGCLRPLSRTDRVYLPEELPHVLKYKGKTNVDFTRMMLNTALSVSDFASSENRLSLLDPMCGKATTLFCAAVCGMNSVGLDVDAKELKEADQYLEKSLQLHRRKYSRKEESRTLKKGGFARCTAFEIPIGNEEALKLSLLQCDLRNASQIYHQAFHLIVCDLPYGVQHAPKADKAMSDLRQIVQALSENAFLLLKKGGALAFSFNEKTLRKDDLIHALQTAGLSPLLEEPFADCSHWVEQAIVRDIVFAIKDR